MKRSASETVLVSCILFLFFFSIFVFGYGGIAVTDDEQLFSSAAISFALHGQLSADQISGNDRLDGSFSGVGPLHPIIAALFLFIIKTTPFGMVQALYLLTPVYTALSIVLFFNISRLEGYDIKTSLIGAIALGLTTIVLPYSKTFFREPLAMMFLLLTLLVFELITRRANGGYIKYILWFLFFLFLICTLFTKFLLVVTIPAFLWLFFYRLKIQTKRIFGELRDIVIVCVLGFIVVLLVTKGVDYFIPEGLSTRLNFEFAKERVFRLKTLPHDAFFSALAGLFFSPGKGFFIYSPILLLAFIPSRDKTRSVRDMCIFAWIVLIGLIVEQALAYNDQWWNITWGTRSLLPAVPLMLLAILPVLKTIITSRSTLLKSLFYILLFFGVVIQFGALLLDDPTYMAALYKKFEVVDPVQFIWNFSYAPFFYYWKLLFQGAPIGLSAWRISQLDSGSLFRYTWFVFLFMAFSVMGFIFHKKMLRMKAIPYIFFLSVILMPLMLSLNILNIARNDPWYYPTRDDIQSASNDLTLLANNEDTILVDYYLSPIWYQFWNYGKISSAWYSLPVPTSTVKDGGSLEINTLVDFLVEKQIEIHDRLWLLTDTNVYELHQTVQIDDRGTTLNICDVRQYESTSDAELTWLYTYCVDTNQ